MKNVPFSGLGFRPQIYGAAFYLPPHTSERVCQINMLPPGSGDKNKLFSDKQ